MTPQEANAGLVELVLPDGGHVLVGFGDGVAGNPEVEASVVQTMLDAGGAEGDVWSALSSYAHGSGLTARYYLGRRSVVVEIDAAAE
jgi:hypothetical protein